MKKYEAPEMKIFEFETEDVMQESGTLNTLPKSFDGAEQVSNQDFVSVFE